MKGIPQPGTPDFIPALVLPDIFNRSYSAFSGLKVDSRRRKRKNKSKKKIIIIKKNSIQIGVNEHNQKKTVDSELKKHIPFSIKVGIYRDISV